MATDSARPTPTDEVPPPADQSREAVAPTAPAPEIRVEEGLPAKGPASSGTLAMLNATTPEYALMSVEAIGREVTHQALTQADSLDRQMKGYATMTEHLAKTSSRLRSAVEEMARLSTNYVHHEAECLTLRKGWGEEKAQSHQMDKKLVTAGDIGDENSLLEPD